MRVAIAGATGLIGHAIAARLAAGGHSIVTIGRHSKADVTIDLAHPESLGNGALEGCDALVHAAGVIDEDFVNRRAAHRKAREGSGALLSAAKQSGIARLMYVSSAHVYGPLVGVIDESRPAAPESDYAVAHREAEELFEEAADSTGSSVLIARPCAVFGMPLGLDRFARWSLIPFSFPREALSGAITLKSTGEQRRNFVSTEGIATLVGWWLESSSPGLTLANAPGPHEMPVFEFARLCAKIAEEETGRPCEVRRPDGPASPDAPLEFRTRVGGHLPGTAIEDHVRALIRALQRAHPNKKETP